MKIAVILAFISVRSPINPLAYLDFEVPPKGLLQLLGLLLLLLLRLPPRAGRVGGRQHRGPLSRSACRGGGAWWLW